MAKLLSITIEASTIYFITVIVVLCWSVLLVFFGAKIIEKWRERKENEENKS